VYVSEYLSNIEKVVRAQIIWRLGSIVVVGLLVAVILNVMLRKLIGRPLTAMVNTVQQFGRGNLTARMPHIETMELGLLADKFDKMAAAIQAADSDRKMRMEKAIDIQMKLLPVPSSLTDLKFTYIFRPAAEVAGDYFDIIRFPDNTFLFCVADIVGHGVPSAMEAAMLKAVLKITAQHEADPQRLIYLLHNSFSEVTPEEDFATVMLVHWKPVEGVINYVSAGHETGYLARSNGQIKELTSTGPILGITGLSEWSEQQFAIEPGDRIILLTDGITETLSTEGEVFGRDRIIEVINKFRQESIETFLDGLMEAVVTFRGSGMQLDDITVLSVDL
jgi:serine phosphatase RsbU (regulator of sigma subunit)